MSQIAISKMRKSDLDVVSELATLANPFIAREKYRDHILDELEDNPDSSFVAVENGRVVGFVQAEVRDGEAMLEDIAVAKKCQGKGVGKRLLDKELKALKRRGARWFWPRFITNVLQLFRSIIGIISALLVLRKITSE